MTAARWLMLLYVGVLPIVRPLDTRILGIHIFATDLIFAGAFLFWLLAAVRRRPWFDPKYLAAAGAFFFALLLSAIFSTEPQKSLLKLTGVFYLIAVSLVVADLIRDDGFLKKLAFAWVAGTVVTIAGSAMGLIGFYAGYKTMATNFFLFHSGSLPPGNYPRVVAFFENPNMTANYLTVAVKMAIGAYRSGWLPARIAMAIVLLVFGSAALTISPGIGGLIAGVGLWTALVRFKPQTRQRTLTLAGVASAALLLALSTAIAPVNRGSEHTVTIPVIEKQIEPSVRFLVWMNTIERGLEYPILGRGIGTDVARVFYQVPSGQKQLLRDAHQAWLNIFGQAGLLGLCAFVWLCIYLFSVCRFTIDEDSTRTVMLVACSCAFVGAFLYQNLFGSFEDARQLWVLIGMLVGLSKPTAG